MIAFRVLRSGAVELALRSSALRVEQALRESVTRLTLKLAAYTKAEKLSGQVLKVRTGTLRHDVNHRVQALAGVVRGTVGVRVRYGAPHEYGFKGQVNIKAHLRTIKQAWGRPIAPRSVPVRAFSRVLELPERSFLRSALADMTPAIRTDLVNSVTRAVQGAA